MANKTTKPKRKSKGKQHPLRAESLERMAQDLQEQSTCNFPLYKEDIVRLFQVEAKRIRGILR